MMPSPDEAQAISDDVKKSFGALAADQLNWRAAADQWSVGQCLDHLILINSGLFPIFERIERGEHRPTFRERIPLIPRLFGMMVLKGVSPQTKHKSKALSKFRPPASAIQADIVERFIVHQTAMIGHMKRLEDLHAGGIVITSPVASVMTYSVRDALRIVVAHERRHVEQARRVTQEQGFQGA